jgi:ABC-type transporter Mla subunit MlaD
VRAPAIAFIVLLCACGSGKSAGTTTSTSTTRPSAAARQFAAPVARAAPKIEAAGRNLQDCIAASCRSYRDERNALSAVIDPIATVARALTAAGTPPPELATLVTRTVDLASTANADRAALVACRASVPATAEQPSHVKAPCHAEFQRVHDDTVEIASVLDAWTPYTSAP